MRVFLRFVGFQLVEAHVKCNCKAERLKVRDDTDRKSLLQEAVRREELWSLPENEIIR